MRLAKLLLSACLLPALASASGGAIDDAADTLDVGADHIHAYASAGDGRNLLRRRKTGLENQGQLLASGQLRCLAPLGGHLQRASEICFIRHDVGLWRCLA